MTARSRRRLVLDLEDGGPADSIGGRLSTDTGEAIEFHGWLGLAGALEAALQSAAGQDTTVREDEGAADVVGCRESALTALRDKPEPRS